MTIKVVKKNIQLKGLLEKLVVLLNHKRLPIALGLIGLLLASPCIFIGFHLDDHFGRYVSLDYPGSEQLLRIKMSPFGIADGKPESNHWQIEQGYLPFWTSKHFLISMWRLVSELDLCPYCCRANFFFRRRSC